MKKLFLLGGLALVAVLLAALIGHGVDALGPSSLDYARQQAELDRLAREAARAEQLAPVDTFVAAAWRLLPLLVAVAGLVYLGALGVAHIARFRDERRPDARGLLPVQLAELPQVGPAALAAHHAARVEEARRPLVPASLSYAPRLDYRAEPGRALAAPADELLPAASGVTVPSFGELLSAGRVGRGPDGRALPLLLGVDAATGGEIAGSWLDLYSTAIGGLPGSGKTTTQRFLACQTALAGAKFVVIDPQAEAGEESLAGTLAPLRAAYLCDAASDDRAILAAVRLVADIGERRVKGRDSDMTPIILWADELTKLLGRSAIGDELAQLLESVAQEFRKKRVFVCGSGQIWTAARTTSELRDSFASVIAHRMKRSQARMLLPTEEAAEAERLDTGRAILWRTSGATATIAVPLTTAEDVRRVAGLLTDDAPRVEIPGRQQATTQATGARVITPPAEAWRKPGGSLMVASGEQATSAPGRATPPSADAARAAALFLAGSDLPAVVYELRQVRSSEGRRYQLAVTEVQQLIRDGLAARELGA